MVGYLTYGNKKFAELDSQIRKLLPSLHAAMKEIVPYIDADTTAYNQYSVRSFVMVGGWKNDGFCS